MTLNPLTAALDGNPVNADFEAKHPRGRDGKFINKFGIVKVFKDALDKTAPIVGQVTKVNGKDDIQVKRLDNGQVISAKSDQLEQSEGKARLGLPGATTQIKDAPKAKLTPEDYGSPTDVSGKPADTSYAADRGITPEERKATHDYSFVNHKPINRGLRGKGPKHTDTDLVESAMQKDTLPTDETLYRGIDIGVLQDEVFEPGTILDDPGFMSTTRDKSKTPEYGDDQIEIRVPKGTHAIDVNKVLGVNTGEDEVILPRNTKLRVISDTVTENGKGPRHLVAELVPNTESGDADKPHATLSNTDATPLSEALDTSDWKKVGGAKGSNPGGFYDAPDGSKWYVKESKTPDHAKNEVLATALYRAAGIEVPEVRLATVNGKTGVASRIIEKGGPSLHGHLDDDDYIKKIQHGFAVDAWLSNWDVAGLVYDNVETDTDGDPFRVDTGGALLYRAMGGPKGNTFGDTVGEIDTLRNGSNAQSAKVFGEMSDADVKQSAELVQDLSPDEIAHVVDEVGFDSSTSDLLKKRLVARRADLLKKVGLDEIPALTNETSTIDRDLTPDEVAKLGLPAGTNPRHIYSNGSVAKIGDVVEIGSGKQGTVHELPDYGIKIQLDNDSGISSSPAWKGVTLKTSGDGKLDTEPFVEHKGPHLDANGKELKKGQIVSDVTNQSVWGTILNTKPTGKLGGGKSGQVYVMWHDDMGKGWYDPDALLGHQKGEPQPSVAPDGALDLPPALTPELPDEEKNAFKDAASSAKHLSADGKTSVKVGDKVKNSTKGYTGTVVKLENNGKYVKVHVDGQPGGKLNGLKTSTLSITNSDDTSKAALLESPKKLLDIHSKEVPDGWTADHLGPDEDSYVNDAGFRVTPDQSTNFMYKVFSPDGTKLDTVDSWQQAQDIVAEHSAERPAGDESYNYGGYLGTVNAGDTGRGTVITDGQPEAVYGTVVGFKEPQPGYDHPNVLIQEPHGPVREVPWKSFMHLKADPGEKPTGPPVYADQLGHAVKAGDVVTAHVATLDEDHDYTGKIVKTQGIGGGVYFDQVYIQDDDGAVHRVNAAQITNIESGTTPTSHLDEKLPEWETELLGLDKLGHEVPTGWTKNEAGFYSKNGYRVTDDASHDEYAVVGPANDVVGFAKSWSEVETLIENHKSGGAPAAPTPPPAELGVGKNGTKIYEGSQVSFPKKGQGVVKGEAIGKNGKWVQVKQSDGTVHQYVHPDNITVTSQPDSLTNQKPGSSAATKAAEPTTAEQPKPEEYVPNGDFVLGYGGAQIFQNSLVKSKKDGLEGQVIYIESNGTHVKVLGADGKVRGRRNTTLEVTGHAYAKDKPVATVAGSPFTGHSKLDKYKKNTPGSHSGPVTVSQAPTHTDSNKLTPPAAVKKTPAVEGPLTGTPKPVAPKSPASGTTEKYLDQAWLDSIEKRYEDFAPGKKLQNSNNWGRVQNVINSGSMSDLQYLLDKNYITLQQFNQAKVQIDARNAEAAKKQAEIAQAIEDWKKLYAEWKLQNDVADSPFTPEDFVLHGMDDALDWKSFNEAQAWAHVVWPYGSAYKKSQLSALKSYTGSGSSSINSSLYHIGAPTMTSLDGIDEVTKKKIHEIDDAMEFAPRVPEPIYVTRSIGYDAFRDSFGNSLHYNTDLTSIQGTVQHNFGYSSTSITGKDKGGIISIKIRVPAGQKAVFVWGNGISGYGSSERELLLDRGVHYYIHSVTKKGSVWIVEAEIVPPGWTP